jgi:uncharacterized peroxidase-related enzyme
MDGLTLHDCPDTARRVVKKVCVTTHEDRLTGAINGSAHNSVAAANAASAGTFSRIKGAVRGDAQKSRIHPQQLAAVWDPEGAVDRGFKRIIAHVASRAAGCQYCMAQTAGGALHFGVEDKKLAAVWEYQTNPLYSPAERTTLDFAVAAASVPNAVTDEMLVALRKHWTEEQIVEIVGVIALFGFLNRWNDTLATPLEDEPLKLGRNI